jgi:hypothetical protein
MRSRVSRHLNPVLLDSDVMFAARGQPLGAPPPEFNWRDYTAMLLHVAAEIEHSLMVQYLFAAYSLGGPQVPSGLRDEVRAWQETIFGVAKEEMGHARGENSNAPGVPAPDLLILEVSSRDTALNALDEIGEQGEAPKPLTQVDPSNAGEDSHLVRFLTIYRALIKLEPPTPDRVSRPVGDDHD